MFEVLTFDREMLKQINNEPSIALAAPQSTEIGHQCLTFQPVGQWVADLSLEFDARIECYTVLPEGRVCGTRFTMNLPRSDS